MADNALCQNEAGKVSAAGRVDSRLCVWREREGGRQQEEEGRGTGKMCARRSLAPSRRTIYPILHVRRPALPSSPVGGAARPDPVPCLACASARAA